jgi:hypothetical protein
MDYRDWLQKREATVFDRAQDFAAKETARREAEAKAGKAQNRANAPTRALPHPLRFDKHQVTKSARPIGTRDPVKRAFGRSQEAFPLTGARPPAPVAGLKGDRPNTSLDRWLTPVEVAFVPFKGKPGPFTRHLVKGPRRGYQGLKATYSAAPVPSATVQVVNALGPLDSYTPAPKPVPPAKSASLTFKPFEGAL